MKKNLLTLVVCFFIVGSVFSQKRNCGSADYLQKQLHNVPGFAEQRRAIDEFEQRIQGQRTEDLVPGQIVKIPVVVHVVYRTTTENISDAQIKTQIDVLKADFRKLNADYSKTPSAFASLVADAQITFELATVDPSGNPTTGITRTSTTATAFSDDDRVKYTSQGGRNAWPRDKYLNIWVCNLDPYLGYAQFPGGTAATDGVVIGYKYFGTTGTAVAPFNKGRTATHEVGHWLNLYHIWGDDGTSCTGSDQVSDTPNQADENYGCPTFPAVSCSNGPNGDMFMNYMDYSDDACMYMFTNGQKNRMRALFATGGARASFVSSTPGTVTYCASKGSNSSEEYINKVVLGSISNLSGNNGGYGNYTSLSTNLTRGASYTITITPRWPGSVYSEAYNVWIDYNKDGDFVDAGEQVYSRAATTSATITGTFIIPSTATVGSTRMRVTLKYNGNATSCETFSYGEVEDYTVNIATSAARLADHDRLILSPNPATSTFNLNGNLNISGHAVKISLFNRIGKRVIDFETNGQEALDSYHFDVSKLEPGIYYMLIKGNGFKETKKLLITR